MRALPLLAGACILLMLLLASCGGDRVALEGGGPAPTYVGNQRGEITWAE